jgi:hypothetical protein
MSDWKNLFRENMAADPEFAVYLKGLEPETPVQPTVKDHVALLNLRAQALEKEAREGNELVALMDAHRFDARTAAGLTQADVPVAAVRPIQQERRVPRPRPPFLTPSRSSTKRGSK